MLYDVHTIGHCTEAMRPFAESGLQRRSDALASDGKSAAARY
jgi:hypothetical protein